MIDFAAVLAQRVAAQHGADAAEAAELEEVNELVADIAARELEVASKAEVVRKVVPEAAGGTDEFLAGLYDSANAAYWNRMKQAVSPLRRPIPQAARPRRVEVERVIAADPEKLQPRPFVAGDGSWGRQSKGWDTTRSGGGNTDVR